MHLILFCKPNAKHVYFLNIALRYNSTQKVLFCTDFVVFLYARYFYHILLSLVTTFITIRCKINGKGPNKQGSEKLPTFNKWRIKINGGRGRSGFENRLNRRIP